MDFKERYRGWANRFCLSWFYAHVPVLMGVAWWFGTGIGTAFLISLAILAGPTASYWLNRSSKLTSGSLACSAMGLSALLIHLGHGMIELHFHIFAVLAFLIVFGRVWPILIAAGTIAAHHLLFWWLLPESVFNYQAGFGMVLVHAFFVIFETVPACWIAVRVGRAIEAQSITTDHLKNVAEQMLSASHHLSAGGEDLSRCALEQASTLEGTSASSSEVRAMSQETAQKIEEAVRCIGEVDLRIQSADEKMGLLTQSMTDISRSSSRISEMIRVIDGIAMQTNILALNAAVESARAGEAGAGFAVVADEVRALARRCSEAAKTSAELISESVENSQKGAESVALITGAIGGMTKRAAEAKHLISHAHTGGREQAKRVTTISDALNQLETITQRTAANAEENASTGRMLEAEADNLMKIVLRLERLADLSHS